MAKTKENLGGTYALLLHLPHSRRLAVGKLGYCEFPRGYYVYVGSALGGLKARVSRHLRLPRVLHWHIDYLQAVADILEVWWQTGLERRECRWAALAASAPGASIPVTSFGSSDCHCLSHLACFDSRPSVAILGAGAISTLDLSGESRVEPSPGR